MVSLLGRLRAAVWAIRTLGSVRRQLRRGIQRPLLPAPPVVPRTAGEAIEALIRRSSATCLEAALVRQQWLAGHSDLRDVVIGLPPEGLTSSPAHAWLDGLEQESTGRYVELHRIAPLPCPSAF